MLFWTSFVGIALLAFQQLNVLHHRRLWVIPTSLGMAYCEVRVVVGIVRSEEWWTFIEIGMGSGLGCIVAMEMHRWLRGNGGSNASS